MMDGVDKGAELDAVRQDSPNRSYVGTDAERPLLPHPTLKMSEARHKPIRIGQGAVSRGFGVSHVGPAGCGVCGSTPYVRSMYLQYYCIMCIMSKRDRCDDPNGAEPFAWLILYL